MPRYSYVCSHPGCSTGTFVITKPMKDADAEETCPSCDSKLKRKFDAPAVKVQGGTPTFHRTR